MWTLHSQKHFFQHFINIFHCWTIIPFQSMSLLSHFLSIPLIIQQKERRQLQINLPNFPSGFPSTLLPSVLAATALHMLADNARRSHSTLQPVTSAAVIVTAQYFCSLPWHVHLQGQLPATKSADIQLSSQHYACPSPQENWRLILWFTNQVIYKTQVSRLEKQHDVFWMVCLLPRNSPDTTLSD